MVREEGKGCRKRGVRRNGEDGRGWSKKEKVEIV